MGHESDFGRFLGSCNYLSAAISNYLRLNNGEFWKKDFALNELNAGIPILQKLNENPFKTKCSEACAVGPSQFLFTTVKKGVFIDENKKPSIDVFDKKKCIFSTANHLVKDGWVGGFDKSPTIDDQSWNALRKYNGCIGYKIGDYRRDEYPGFVIDMGDLIKEKVLKS